MFYDEPIFQIGPDQNIDNFLKKYPPSATSSKKHGPWIWILPSPRNNRHGPTSEGKLEAEKEGSEVLGKLEMEIANIESDPDIPTRASKNKPRSKKMVREECYELAKQEFQNIAMKTGYTSGKWLFFRTREYCDATFAMLAKSLVNGALSCTKAFTLKIATTDEDVPQQQYVICLYLPDIFDQQTVEEVLKVLLEDHNILPSSAKPDLYTEIGLDSKHPSKMSAVIWKPTDFWTKQDIQEMMTTAKQTRVQAATKDEESDEEGDDYFVPMADDKPKPTSTIVKKDEPVKKKIQSTINKSSSKSQNKAMTSNKLESTKEADSDASASDDEVRSCLKLGFRVHLLIVWSTGCTW